MQKTIIGHIDCPTCGHADMQVKEDKNGHAFGFCPDCASQLFTRNDFRDKRLRERMRPVTVTVTEPKPAEPPEQPVTAPTVPAVPKPQPTPKKPATVPPAPPAPAKKAGFFDVVLSGGK